MSTQVQCRHNGTKENGRGGEFKNDIVQYAVRTFANATMYPHPAQQLKK
jgi:hypothetical protein